MRVRLAFLFAAALLAGCGTSLKTVEPPAKLTDFEPELKVSPVWSAQVDQGAKERFLQLAPALDSEVLYATARDGLVRAFDRLTGEPLWKVRLNTRIFGGASVGGDLLLIGGDAAVVALDRATGAERWRADVSTEVLAAPVRSGDVVVARAIDGSLFGLSASDGHTLWQVRQEVPLLSLRGQSRPAVGDGLVLAGFANGKLGAYRLLDGQQVWEATVAVPRGRTELERIADVDAALTVVEGGVFAAGYQGRVAAFALSDGHTIWARDLSTYTGTALFGRTLFLTDSDGNAWALDAGTGRTLWKQEALRGRSLSAPAIQGNAIVVGDFAGYLHWLAVEDGHLIARVRVEDPDYYFPVPDPEGMPNNYQEKRGILAAPKVVRDTVYAVDRRGAVNAFRVQLVEK